MFFRPKEIENPTIADCVAELSKLHEKNKLSDSVYRMVIERLDNEGCWIPFMPEAKEGKKPRTSYHCPKCGSTSPIARKFCPECGKDLRDTEGKPKKGDLIEVL